MFYVNGTNIKLTRGDSASLSVSLDGYEMQDGDTLTLSVKVDPSKSEYLLQLTADGDSFAFLPEMSDFPSIVKILAYHGTSVHSSG